MPSWMTFDDFFLTSRRSSIISKLKFDHPCAGGILSTTVTYWRSLNLHLFHTSVSPVLDHLLKRIKQSKTRCVYLISCRINAD